MPPLPLRTLLRTLLCAALPALPLQATAPHTIMLPTRIAAARSAWKGPFFVAMPNLAEALKSNIPIRTNARASTILPNYVG